MTSFKHILLGSLAAATTATVVSSSSAVNFPRGPVGDISAVYELLERVLPGSSSHFALSLSATCQGVPNGQPCFTMSDNGNNGIAIAATSASEITAAIGLYMRDFCNMTIGWPRGGGSNIFTPSTWPLIGSTPYTRARVVPWSYIENVCTHSYSLVWYNWTQWSNYIDWMALSGINMNLGVTGQEEIAYKVFSKFGLDDMTIRSWFNGPAFLTWSRGQNEYGNNIAGPLPRSFMQDQWTLQQQILARSRSLGIGAQLPGFQGNVPWALASAQNDNNMTQQGDTGWMYSTDPLFAKLADAYMQTMCVDFNCSAPHVYQMDGYFDGGTAPWAVQGVGPVGSPGAIDAARQQGRAQNHKKVWPASSAATTSSSSISNVDSTACIWSSVQPNTYLAGCDATNCASYPTIAAAQAACIADLFCGGITSQANGVGPWELRAANAPSSSPSAESSYYIVNYLVCRPPPPPITPDPVWMERGAAAYAGLARTDPDAIWSFQGWAIIDWSTYQQGSSFSGFVDAVPANHFMVIDMSVDGSGEWQKWNGSSFFGAPFIWTTLHDFGGTDAMKGDIARINEIPSTGMLPMANTTVWGTGMTPEGIDQNPVYYEFMTGTNWRAQPVTNITQHTITRAHRRYGMTSYSENIANAWSLFVNSTYAQDLSVQDPTGIPHFPGSSSQFESDRVTPTPRLCLTFQAWELLLEAASELPNPALETYRYDLVNVGREMLAQLSTPVSQNFSDAVHAKAPLDAALIQSTGDLYLSLLADVDALVATDSAFLIGPWLQMARNLGTGNNDCTGTIVGDLSCEDFMEWNARSQLTTWNPTPANAAQKPGGPDDYASKHWSGLINDYYRARALGIQQQALSDAAAGQALNTTMVAKFEATLAYEFQTAFPSAYPVEPVGDAIAISKSTLAKWGVYYSSC